MKNITIGHIHSSWKSASSAHYYAERGDGDEYAFGKTPSDALLKLEQREAAIVAKFDKNMSEVVAFLAIGATEYLHQHRGTNLTAYGGYMGIINDVIQCAPLLERRWALMEVDEFNDVWLYDVVEWFGQKWTEALLHGEEEKPDVLLEEIIAAESEKWN